MDALRRPRIGWCGPIQNALNLKIAGLDYIEAQLVPMRLENDSSYAEAKARVTDSPLPIEAMSYLFPHEFRLFGEGSDETRNRKYFDKVVTLLDLAQAQVVVLGSGWTRNIPKGWSLEQTEQAFLETLQWCADALNGSCSSLVIEPLNRKESNLINNVNDAVRLVKTLNHPKISGLADFYHMDEEREPLETIKTNGPWLGHIHLADTHRLNPGTGSYDYSTFFRYLKAINYSGKLSAECGIQGDPIDAMRFSLDFLNNVWTHA